LAGEAADTLSLIRRGERIAAAAFRLGTPEIFVVDLASGHAVWAFADEKAARAYRFKCNK
jgi:hypothetical protein